MRAQSEREREREVKDTRHKSMAHIGRMVMLEWREREGEGDAASRVLN
jgi:hypothetical protein